LGERVRWPLWLPVGLGTGIGLYFALPFEPSVTIAVLSGGSAICFAMLAAWSGSSFARAFLALLAAIAFGFAVAKARTEFVAAPVLTHKVGPAYIEGQVVEAQIHGKGQRAVFAPSRIGHLKQLPRFVRVSFRGETDLLVPGHRVGFKAVLMPPPPPATPDGYDFGRDAYYDRIGGVGYAYGEPVALDPPSSPGWRERLAKTVELMRWRVTQRIQNVLPGSTGGIAAALITGDRGGISTDDEAALRDAGLAHVLAIAGLHMALVGLGLFWAIRAVLALFPVIALNYPIKKWAAVGALGGAAFYLLISGSATPASRAFIMLAIMLVSVLLDRPALSMRSLAFAATILLLMQPETLITPGFQMSFAAVSSLIAVAEWEQARHAKRDDAGGWQSPYWRSLRRYLGGIATTSLVGSLATAPYAAFHFDRATHYAVLGNLLAMPVMGFIAMPAAAISVILMPLGLDRVPLHVMGWGIDIMLAIGRWVSALPGSVTAISARPVSALVLISLGGLWIVIWRRPWRWLGLLPVAAGIAIAILTTPPDILVGRDGETVAVRGNDGLLRLIREPKDDYTASEWMKRDGDTRDIAGTIGTRANGVRCDGDGCTARTPDGALVAITRRVDGLADDCGQAAVVISAVPVRSGCAKPKLVIDRFAVARSGAYAVWLKGKTARVETVQNARGDRPWSQPPRRRQSKQISNGG
jgi:competence protein ComEC